MMYFPSIKQRAFAVLALGLFAMAPSAFAQNLLTNGDFENSAANPGNSTAHYTGWNEIWNFGVAGQNLINADGQTLQNWGVETANPFAGGFSAKNFHDGGIYQSVAVTGSQHYILDAAIFIPSGGDGPDVFWGAHVNVLWLNSLGTTLTASTFGSASDPRDQWNAIHQVLTAPAAATTARIELATFNAAGVEPASPTRYDNISLQLAAVPESSTLLMFIAALCAMFPWIRRRVIS